jgi:hypothetical protein
MAFNGSHFQKLGIRNRTHIHSRNHLQPFFWNRLNRRNYRIQKHDRTIGPRAWAEIEHRHVSVRRKLDKLSAFCAYNINITQIGWAWRHPQKTNAKRTRPRPSGAAQPPQAERNRKILRRKSTSAQGRTDRLDKIEGTHVLFVVHDARWYDRVLVIVILSVYKHRTNSAGTPRKVASKDGGNRQFFPSHGYDCGSWICIGRIEGHFCCWCCDASFWPALSWGFFHSTCVMEHSVVQFEPLSATDRLICPDSCS